MSKRFFETQKWDDRWYTSLGPDAKLCIEYMQGTCDVAGVWEPNFEVAEFKMGFTAAKRTIEWDEIFEELNRIPPERVKSEEETKPKPLIPHVLVIRSGKWWMPRFVQFQYGKAGSNFFLSETAPVHIPIFRSLRSNDIWERFCSYYPDCVPKHLLKQPPSALVGARGLPTLDDVRKWEEAVGMDDAEIRMFYYHYKTTGWRVNGQRPDDLPALLGKWRAKHERDLKEANWKRESPAALKLRIEACEKKIADLREQTWTPPGKQHSEVKPEAMAEIKRQKGLKEQYETELRERERPKGKKPNSGSGENATPGS